MSRKNKNKIIDKNVDIILKLHTKIVCQQIQLCSAFSFLRYDVACKWLVPFSFAIDFNTRSYSHESFLKDMSFSLINLIKTKEPIFSSCENAKKEKKNRDLMPIIFVFNMCRWCQQIFIRLQHDPNRNRSKKVTSCQLRAPSHYLIIFCGYILISYSVPPQNPSIIQLMKCAYERRALFASQIFAIFVYSVMKNVKISRSIHWVLVHWGYALSVEHNNCPWIWFFLFSLWPFAWALEPFFSFSYHFTKSSLHQPISPTNKKISDAWYSNSNTESIQWTRDNVQTSCMKNVLFMWKQCQTLKNKMRRTTITTTASTARE